MSLSARMPTPSRIRIASASLVPVRRMTIGTVTLNWRVAATRQFKVKVPIVIRLTGTNEAEAIKILEAVGMRALSDMDQAVEQVVQLARGAA